MVISTAAGTPGGTIGPDAPDHRGVTLSEKLAYALGATGASMSWNLATGFLVFYYSDVVGIPLSIVGTLMLVTRILDALFDPLAGVFVDRTRTRWGKARPYLLVAPLGFAILMGLTFAVPQGSVLIKTTYAFVTFTLLGLFYSFYYVPFGALLPTMARSQGDRYALASMRSVGISVGAITIYAVTLPLVKFFGGSSQGTGFTAVASLAGLFCTAAMLIVFLVCRERTTVATAPIVQGLAEGPGRFAWMRNPIWRTEIILSFSMFIRLGITVSATAYYAKAVLQNVDIVSYMLPLSAVAPLLAGLFSPFFLRALGVRWGNVTALTLSTICYLLLPLLGGWLPVYLAVFFVANLSIGINTASLFVMFADACDLQEHRDGTRREGLLGSTASFCGKVGGAVGAAILAFALSLSGYRPEDPTRSTYMIDLMFWLAPAVICAVQALFMARFRTAREHIEAEAAA